MAYAQAYDHLGKITAGGVNGHDLMLRLTPDTGVSFYAGAVCSLKTNGKVQLGAAGVTSLILLAENGTADLDVDGGDDWNVVTASNTQMGFYPLSGRCEYKTTEFVDGTYNPGSLLVPATAGNAGKLTAQSGELGDTGACGVVTKGKFTDAISGQSVVQFLGVYFPGHTHAATT